MTSATNTSSITRIEPATTNVLADELSFPFIGGLPCGPKYISEVCGDIIGGVGLRLLVATCVGVGTVSLDAGFAYGVGVEVG